MSIALGKLAAEDPSFRVSTDEESGQTIISGMGELHLEIIVDRLKREFKVEAEVGAPQVAYRETIRTAVNQEYKYAKQSGGRGQYGLYSLSLSLLEGWRWDMSLLDEDLRVGWLFPKRLLFLGSKTKGFSKKGYWQKKGYFQGLGGLTPLVGKGIGLTKGFNFLFLNWGRVLFHGNWFELPFQGRNLGFFKLLVGFPNWGFFKKEGFGFKEKGQNPKGFISLLEGPY